MLLLSGCLSLPDPVDFALFLFLFFLLICLLHFFLDFVFGRFSHGSRVLVYISIFAMLDLTRCDCHFAEASVGMMAATPAVSVRCGWDCRGFPFTCSFSIKCQLKFLSALHRW